MENKKKGMAGWLKLVIALAVVATVGAVGYFGATGGLFQGDSFTVSKLDYIQPSQLAAYTKPVEINSTLQELQETKLLGFRYGGGMLAKQFVFNVELAGSEPFYISDFKFYRDGEFLKDAKVEVANDVNSKYGKVVTVTGNFGEGTYYLKGIAGKLKSDSSLRIVLENTKIEQRIGMQ